MARLRTLYVYTALILGGLAYPATASVGVAIKGGVQSLQNPLTLEDSTRSRFEAEFSTSSLTNEHLELTLGIGGVSVASASDTYTTYDSYGTIQDTYEDKFRMYDVRLGARLYPLNPCTSPDPKVYVGGGLGYYWLMDHWEDTHIETVDSQSLVIEDKTDGRITTSKGFFPYVTAGLDIPFHENASLLFEFQYDFAKKDKGVDYGGAMYMLGLRVRW